MRRQVQGALLVLAGMCLACPASAAHPHSQPQPIHPPAALAAFAAERGEAEPTIVYTLTKREAQEIAAELGVRQCCGR